ncbi:MAG: hypothetical protein H3C43_12700 [Leptonema sp. (in: Bacteria)]|nr:hypothetical protein [Leptonema sp. (in: bacteria)]
MRRKIFIFLLLVNFINSCATHEQNPPKAQGGVLSLSSESLRYPLPLVGEWDFYYN